jgi:pimeloyl-ACP methyl ester carboxylesterase
VEPSSHFFYSHRLKLQLWDYGGEGKPPLILTHGGLDHARNWDFAAAILTKHFHVYAWDLRGHGNSQWAPGAAYAIAEHVLDLAALVDIVGKGPVRLIGHSLGGVVSTIYTGLYPQRVERLVNIEGWGPPPQSKMFRPASERMRDWIENVRQAERRDSRSYPNLDAAIGRMKEANKHLSDAQARHLTIHGTNWNADGSLVWKFDNFARVFPPYGQRMDEMQEVLSHIECPVLLFWGMESWATDPETDVRVSAIRNRRCVKVANAGHWLHHDQLQIFVDETLRFLEVPTATACDDPDSPAID